MLWRWMSGFIIMTLFLAACSGNSTVIPTALPPTEALIIPTETPIGIPPLAAEELESVDDMLAYLVARQHDVALVSYSVNPDGSIADDAPVVMHQANEPMALAATMTILTLAGYAWEVEQGILDPKQLIKLADVEAWHFPYADGGMHKQALNQIVISSDERGYSTQTATVRLEQIIDMMVIFGDPAAADFVLALLQPETIQMLLDQFDIQGQELPASFLGSFLQFLFLSRGEDETYFELFESQTLDERHSQMQDLIDGYMADPSKYHEWAETTTTWPEYAVEQRYFQTSMPDGTALGYAKLLALVATGNFVAPAVSERMRSHLDWLRDAPAYTAKFSQFGGKAGSIPGVLTEIFYITSKTGPWKDKPRVVVLFQRDLPDADLASFSESYLHHDFEMELVTNPEFAQQVTDALNQP